MQGPADQIAESLAHMRIDQQSVPMRVSLHAIADGSSWVWPREGPAVACREPARNPESVVEVGVLIKWSSC